MLDTTDIHRAEAFYNTGKNYFNSKCYREAIECFYNTVKLDRILFADAWLYMGRAFSQLERYNEAIRYYTEFIQLYEADGLEKNTKETVDIRDIYYLKGFCHFALKTYGEAIECFDKAIKKDPDFAEAYHYKGIAFGNLERYGEAIECFDKAIKKDPDFIAPDALRNKGFVLAKLGKHNEAMECIDRAIDLRPYFVHAWNAKGYHLLHYKEECDADVKYDEILECFDKAIDTDPTFSYSSLNKGYVLYRLKKYDKALKCLNKAINIDANNSFAWNYKGYVHLALKQYDNAIVDFDKSIETDFNNNADAWNYKGIALLNSSRPKDEAIKCFDMAIRIRPNYAPAFNNKGYVINSLGNFGKAIEFFDRAIRIHPDFAEAYHYKGIAFGNLERYGEAIECFDKAIDILKEKLQKRKEFDLDRERTLADILRKKGFALGRLGKYDEAMKCYNDSVEKYKIIKHHDNDICIDLAYALNSKGYFIILYSLKKYDKIAIECFDESLEYYPKFAYPWYNKGFILCKEKKYKEAIECLDRSISVDRNFAYAWLNKAYALNGFGKYTEALACFDKAIDLLYKNEKADDSLANAWYNKGYALSSLKRYKEAIECFDNTIDICKSLKHYNNSKEMDSELAYALYNKGYALNCLGEHEEAIKSFNDSLEIKNFKEHVVYLRIGQSKYEIGNYTGALHDFQNIKDPSLVDEKHYYMGLCYHKQDSFKQAEEEYNEAIKSKSGPIKATAYYNLGVLYYNQNKQDTAKTMFEKCISINPNFSKAREAISKLKVSEQSDWYNWWFLRNKGKVVLGMLLIASILSPLAIVALLIGHAYYFSQDFADWKQFIESNSSVLITGVLLLMGLSISVLLLPSLTKVKVGSVVDLETVQTARPVIIIGLSDIKPSANMSLLKHINMPTEVPHIQPSQMPLQVYHNSIPFRSVNMALASHDSR